MSATSVDRAVAVGQDCALNAACCNILGEMLKVIQTLPFLALPVPFLPEG